MLAREFFSVKKADRLPNGKRVKNESLFNRKNSACSRNCSTFDLQVA
jgi:hypothetical protein